MKIYVTDNSSSCIDNWIGNLLVTPKSKYITWVNLTVAASQGPANKSSPFGWLRENMLVWIQIKNTPTLNKLCYVTWLSLLSHQYNSQLTSLSLGNSNSLLGESPLLIGPIRPSPTSFLCKPCCSCIHSPDLLLYCHNDMTTRGKYGLW